MAQGRADMGYEKADIRLAEVTMRELKTRPKERADMGHDS